MVQAIHPTEKAYRPSHRASVHSAIIQDVSYYGVLEIKGPLKVLSKVLGKCCDPQTSVTSTRCSAQIHPDPRLTESSTVTPVVAVPAKLSYTGQTRTPSASSRRAPFSGSPPFQTVALRRRPLVKDWIQTTKSGCCGCIFIPLFFSRFTA